MTIMLYTIVLKVETSMVELIIKLAVSHGHLILFFILEILASLVFKLN